MLTAGTKIGPYEVVALIGEGGMGQVYKARDTRLGRDVAIKILPAAFSSDVERLRRFEQEARAAAALNHSNILALYDIGTDPAHIVSELLEGESLRQRLQSASAGSSRTPASSSEPSSGQSKTSASALTAGGLSLRKSIDYAVQIVSILYCITSLGFDPIWFGVMSMLMLSMGLVFPPVGMIAFVVASSANVSLVKVYTGTSILMIALVLTTVLLMVFPQIALWLPATMK